MSDSRIATLRRVVREMGQGQFSTSLEFDDADDDLSQLGRDLAGFGSHLETRFAEVGALLEICGSIQGGLNLTDLLDYIYDAFGGVLPYDRLGCALIGPSGHTVRSVWARSGTEHLEIDVHHSACLEGSSLQTIIETGKPRIINDLNLYLEQKPSSLSTRKIVREGIRSSLTCPLIVESVPIGFLFFSSNQAGMYQDAHVDTYQRIARQVSVMVERARIHQVLVETRKGLSLANRQLEILANRDGLTGVASRRHFDHEFRRAWYRCLRNREALAMLMIDIDCFKAFNDRYGHIRGDECLKRVAQKLDECATRGTDLVSRYGGEEFAVLIAGSSEKEACSIAEKLRREVAALGIPHEDCQSSPIVTISVGVASSIPTRNGSMSRLLSAADSALYRAKHAGRNRVAGKALRSVSCSA